MIRLTLALVATLAVVPANPAMAGGNRGPIASFSYFPADPVAGETVALTSNSTDDDGSIEREVWDLDDDGSFDDATGRSASFTPPRRGTYRVRLRVVDDRGAAATASKTFTVAAAPDGPQPTADPTLLEPFPTVRITGRTTRNGVKLNRLLVRGPSGARIELRCAGPACPRKLTRTIIRTGGRAAATVRFKSFERELRAGTLLQVFVTQEGRIGKYTRFRFRRLALPIRTDLCAVPGRARPVTCPR